MKVFISLLFVIVLVIVACKGHDEKVGLQVNKSTATERAKRRAYDGAPPVIPHNDFGANCIECHGRFGMQVNGVGYSPPSPHAQTSGLSDEARCQQCHLFQTTDENLVKSSFVGLKQDLRKGERHHVLAPPVMPHALLMRENCLACHGGVAAREELRCSHPERDRCTQCHLEKTTDRLFEQD